MLKSVWASAARRRNWGSDPPTGPRSTQKVHSYRADHRVAAIHRQRRLQRSHLSFRAWRDPFNIDPDWVDPAASNLAWSAGADVAVRFQLLPPSRSMAGSSSLGLCDGNQASGNGKPPLSQDLFAHALCRRSLAGGNGRRGSFACAESPIVGANHRLGLTGPRRALAVRLAIARVISGPFKPGDADIRRDGADAQGAERCIRPATAPYNLRSPLP